MLEQPTDQFAIEAIQPQANAGSRRRALTKHYIAVNRKTVEGIIEQCQTIREGRKQLPDGEWGEWVTNDLRLGCNSKSARRVAEYKLLIADDKILSNAKYYFALPSSWYTLYLLVALSDEQKRQWIEDGTIHPEMKQHDAKALWPGKKQDAPPCILAAEILRLIHKTQELADDEALENLLSDPGPLTPEKAEEVLRRCLRWVDKWRASSA